MANLLQMSLSAQAHQAPARRSGCSHGKRWTETCWACRLISINSLIKIHEGELARLREERTLAEGNIKVWQL